MLIMLFFHCCLKIVVAMITIGNSQNIAPVGDLCVAGNTCAC